MSKLFGHGDLRLWVLKLIDEHPRHGYDIISGLEDQFLGVYSPSPGTVYPRLAALESEGLIQVEREEEGRKVYRLTAKGKEELQGRADELKELGDRLARSARDMARDVRADVKAAVRDLRAEVRRAATEVRRDERRGSRTAREAQIEARRQVRDAAREVSSDVRSAVRSLQAELDTFVADVLGAARRHELDRKSLAVLREAIKQARAAILDVLSGDESQSKTG